MIYAKFESTGICLMVLMLSVLMFHCSNPKVEEQQKEPVPDKSAQREKPKLVYDNNGNITERHAFNYRSDNSIRSAEIYYYKYDDLNNLVEEIKESSNPNGELIYKNINHYIYNDLNQKVEQRFTSYDKNNQIRQQSRNTFRYNSKGETIEDKSYYLSGAVKSIIYTVRSDAGEINSEEYIHMNEDGKKTDHKKYHYTKYGLERTEDLINK